MSDIDYESEEVTAEIEQEAEQEEVEQQEEQPEAKEDERPSDDGKSEDDDPWKDYDPGFDEKQQEFINTRVVAKQFAKRKEAEEKWERERQERERIEQELMRFKEPQRPEVPPLPDAYDDDYEAKVQRHYEAKAAQELYDRQKAAREQQREIEERQRQQREMEEFAQTVNSYSERARNLGISEVELQAAGNAVKDYGITNDIANHILHDKQGPQVTMYLAKNPLEVEKLQTMLPTQAAVYIETQIKPKAIASKAKPNDTPPPVETPAGKGAPEGQRGPKNATYE